MKLVSRAAEDPTKMGAALGADRDLPAPAGEPRERLFGRSDVDATGSGDEAAEVVDDPRGVDEVVLVRPTAFGAIAPIGDPVATHTAAQRVIVASARVALILGLFFRHACRVYLTRTIAIRY